MVAIKPDYEVAEYGGRECLIVRRWTDECVRALREHARPVVLNEARGWKVTSVSFLSGLEVSDLAILAHEPVPGLESLQAVRGLRRLSLACEATRAIALDGLSDLRECWLEWSKEYETVLSVGALERLGISGFPFPDLSRLGGLKALEKLSIKGGKLRTVSGIEGLAKTLKALELAGLNRLEEIEELASLGKLENLRMDGCRRVKSVRPIEGLAELRDLELSDMGELESLSPVRGLRRLERLIFIESTNVSDGDLSYLNSLPVLREVAFQDRRHYTHTALMGLARPIRKPWVRRRRD